MQYLLAVSPRLIDTLAEYIQKVPPHAIGALVVIIVAPILLYIKHGGDASIAANGKPVEGRIVRFTAGSFRGGGAALVEYTFESRVYKQIVDIPKNVSSKLETNSRIAIMVDSTKPKRICLADQTFDVA